MRLSCARDTFGLPRPRRCSRLSSLPSNRDFHQPARSTNRDAILTDRARWDAVASYFETLLVESQKRSFCSSLRIAAHASGVPPFKVTQGSAYDRGLSIPQAPGRSFCSRFRSSALKYEHMIKYRGQKSSAMLEKDRASLSSVASREGSSVRGVPVMMARRFIFHGAYLLVWAVIAGAMLIFGDWNVYYDIGRWA